MSTLNYSSFFSTFVLYIFFSLITIYLIFFIFQQILLRVSLSFLCNFKPKFNDKKSKIFKKKIFCKNFIVFLMFLNYSSLFNSNVFVKPLKKIKSFSLLKAPHRFKTSQHILCFSRYEVVASIQQEKCSELIYLNLLNIPQLISHLKSIFLKIDSSICTQKARVFSVKKPFTNYFLLSY